MSEKPFIMRSEEEKMNLQEGELSPLDRRFLLLQINDALFPIGSFSHSFGLETYIAKSIVKDGQSAYRYIRANMESSFLYSELLPARLAWEAASKSNVEAIAALEDVMTASRGPEEIRQAGIRIASRFIKTVVALDIKTKSETFAVYCAKKDPPHHRATAYGVFCACMGIPKDDALLHFLYAQCSGMVTNLVKAVPLSQSEGQRLLAKSHGIFTGILNRVDQLDEKSLCLCTPGFDIRSMQHEALYSRMYMS